MFPIPIKSGSYIGGVSKVSGNLAEFLIVMCKNDKVCINVSQYSVTSEEQGLLTQKQKIDTINKRKLRTSYL